ncbi:chalcone isomerase family protein [Vibrio olivae]|uniref:Chalcone isomerase family protein n=1 Tax=Vibrio olivae TaxID=1243002 RepID=A0ABV5HKY5_9VIBR
MNKGVFAKFGIILCAVFFIVPIALSSPPSIQKDRNNIEGWQGWPMVGEAELSVFVFDIYRSTLFTPSGKYLPQGVNEPLALSITYLRDISSTKLLEATAEQWQKLGFNQQQVSSWIPVLEGIFPDVEPGDTLTYLSQGKYGHFIFKPKNQAQESVGDIDNQELSQAFLSIWLSPNTTYPKLRKQLIGEQK